MNRYALQLTDTIQVGSEKSALLTEGLKNAKDIFFYDNAESEDEEKPKKSDRKAPALSRTNGSPAKGKAVGGKVLRNNRATQDEVHKSAAAKLLEHQKELHEKLHQDGLEKYSEEGAGVSGKEGKGWKKFQSYKGEGALPHEADRLRVWVISDSPLLG
jgi:nucleosome binding factor SPN SPT16 subunit